jgi:ribonuclease BN (tRNA processing enzyme)
MDGARRRRRREKTHALHLSVFVLCKRAKNCKAKKLMKTHPNARTTQKRKYGTTSAD